MCVISAHSGAPSAPLVPKKCSSYTNVISRYWSNMCSRYWSHSFCLHQAVAAEMSSLLLTRRSACIWSGIIDLFRLLWLAYSIELLFIIAHFMSICLGLAALVSRRVNRPKAGHAALTGMSFLFRSTLLTGDSLVKFLLDHFFLEAAHLQESSYDWQGDLGKREYLEKRKCLDLSGRKGALCSRLCSILHQYL